MQTYQNLVLVRIREQKIQVHEDHTQPIVHLAIGGVRIVLGQIGLRYFEEGQYYEVYGSKDLWCQAVEQHEELLQAFDVRDVGARIAAYGSLFVAVEFGEF